MGTRRNKLIKGGKTYRGGKVLGQGHFSKVIYPAIPCEDGRNLNGMVSRISKTKEYRNITSKFRSKIINKLKKIDPTQKYFIYPEYCKPGELTEENKADGITDDLKKYSEYMPVGSEETYFKKYTLPTKINKQQRTWKEFFLMKKHKYVAVRSEESLKEIEKAIAHLKKGLELLHKAKIAHRDIHANNIIFGTDGLPRLIDFGEATDHATQEEMDTDKFFIENNTRILTTLYSTRRK
jgi:serine/threonine protein kinase